MLGWAYPKHDPNALGKARIYPGYHGFACGMIFNVQNHVDYLQSALTQ